MPGNAGWRTLPLEIRQKILLDFLRSCVPDPHESVSDYQEFIHNAHKLSKEYRDEGYECLAADQPLDCPYIPDERPLKQAVEWKSIFSDQELRHPVAHFSSVFWVYVEYLFDARRLHVSAVQLARNYHEGNFNWYARDSVVYLTKWEVTENAAQAEFKEADRARDKIDNALIVVNSFKTVFGDWLSDSDTVSRTRDFLGQKLREFMQGVEMSEQQKLRQSMQRMEISERRRLKKSAASK